MLVTGITVTTPLPRRVAVALALSLLTTTAGRRLSASLPREGSKSATRISPLSTSQPVAECGLPNLVLAGFGPLLPGFRVVTLEVWVHPVSPLPAWSQSVLIVQGPTQAYVLGKEVDASVTLGLGDKATLELMHSEALDEDPNRAGRSHLGRPIYRPDEVPADADVILALPPAVAESVWRRLGGGAVQYHRPPGFPRSDPVGSPAIR